MLCFTQFTAFCTRQTPKTMCYWKLSSSFSHGMSFYELLSKTEGVSASIEEKHQLFISFT